MIKLIDVDCYFGSRPILAQQNWMLGDSDRVGLVGENGSGKSTLLKLMASLQDPDRGKLEVSGGLRIGYLPQSGLTHAGRSLDDEVRSALSGLLGLEAESNRIEERLTRENLTPDEQSALLNRMAELNEMFRVRGGYELNAQIGRVLAGLGFSEEERFRPVESFSGGWQMRIALAKLLLSQPQALLLDEPTNHLDIEARNWLEDYLRAYPYSYLIVSHDRYFLDVTVDRIVEVDRGELVDYRGNYSHFVVEKEKRVEMQQLAYDRVEEERQRHVAFINKYKADKKRAGQVQTRAKQIERLPKLEPPRSQKPIRFTFPPAPRGPQEVMKLTGVRKAYGEKVVLNDVDVCFFRGEKVALVGHNGAGKSTLMEIMAGRKKADTGQRTPGIGCEMAFFGQDAGEDLEPDDTVLKAIGRDAPFDMFPRLRNLLGAFLFSGDDSDKKVRVLSGGEKSRLALAKLLLRPSNLILLDEPTNHLDLRAKEVLMDAFRQFTGTLVFVAHDRYFMEDLPDRIIEVSGGKLHNYNGDYTDYLNAKAFEAAGGGAGGPDCAIKKEKEPPPADTQERMQKREEDKARRREEQKYEKKLQNLERWISDAENEVKRIEERMAAPDVASNYMKLIELEKEKAVWEQKLIKFYEEWEILHGNDPFLR